MILCNFYSNLRRLFMAVMASAVLIAGGCKSLGTGDDQSPQTTLKGVYDNKYSLRLASAGYHGLFKFEVCLLEVAGHAGAHCVDAFKTNTQENLLLTFKSIDMMSLSDQHKQDLVQLNQKYVQYQESIAAAGRSRHGEKIGAGILIGTGLSHLAETSLKNRRLPNIKEELAEWRRLQNLSPEDLDAARSARYQNIEMIMHGSLERASLANQTAVLAELNYEIAAETTKLQQIEALIMSQKESLSGFDEVQARLGMSSLSEMNKDVARIQQKFTVAGLSPESAIKSVASPYTTFDRKSVLHPKFIDFIANEFGVNDTLKSFESIESLKFNLSKLNVETYSKWIAQGGTVNQIVAPEFLGQIFEFNKIENALSPKNSIVEALRGLTGTTVSVRPTNVDELHQALLSGDFSFLKHTNEFIQARGVSPTAMALYKKLENFKSILPKEQASISQLEEEAKRVALARDELAIKVVAVEEDIAKSIGQLSDEAQAVKAFSSTKVAKSLGGETARGSSSNLVSQLAEEADQLVRKIRIMPKGITAVALIATGVVAGVVSIAAPAAQSTQRIADSQAQSVMGIYDQLQVLLNQDSPLLTTESSYNVPLERGSTVEALLHSFGAWQSMFWVDEQDTGIVVTHICLPSQSLVDNTVIEECKVIEYNI